MPLGKESALKLATCHTDLRRLIELVSKGIDEGDLAYAGIHDLTVLCGYRGKSAQDKAVSEGHSKTPWPRSAHNHVPSDAVDVAPYPIPLDAKGGWDTEKFTVLHAYVAGVAQGLGIDLFDISWDRPHIQRQT